MAKLKKPNQGWAWIPNTILQNKNLTLKAKGLWAYLNSKPEGWDFSAERIAAEQADGREAVKSALRELENAGLLVRTITSKGYATFETTYELKTKIDGGKIVGGKYADEKHADIIKQNKVKQNKVKQNENNLMSAPAKPAPTRELPNEAKELAHLLHYLILQNKPDRRIQDGWTDRWAEDIEKAHRIDGRSWEHLKAAIIWSQRDDFWKQNILSGEKLRKHYDRMSDRARAEREKNGSQELAAAIFSQDGTQAVATAQRMGLLP